MGRPRVEQGRDWKEGIPAPTSTRSSSTASSGEVARPHATRRKKYCGVSITCTRLGVTEQVAVVDRAQPEQFEQLVPLHERWRC